MERTILGTFRIVKLTNPDGSLVFGLEIPKEASDNIKSIHTFKYLFECIDEITQISQKSQKEDFFSKINKLVS